MVGIPEETDEEVLSTFRFCADLRPDAVRVSMFCPFPGTDIHKDLVSKGLLEDTETVYGFLRRSVLRWPEEMHRFLEKVLVIHPWLLNSHLDCTVGPWSAELVEWVLSAPGKLWEDENFREELDVRSGSMLAEFEREGLPHYRDPFPERPDWAFLKTRRRRPLINVDETGSTRAFGK